jgi:hypothetical protein
MSSAGGATNQKERTNPKKYVLLPLALSIEVLVFLRWLPA